MAMNFEIEIVTKSYIGLDQILHFLNENGLDSSIEHINSIDSWAWENMTEIGSLAEVSTRLKEGKIIVSTVSMHSGNELGIYIDSTSHLIHYSFWFNVDKIGETKVNQSMYNRIYALIDKSIDQLKYELISGGIGIEMLFNFCNDIEETIAHSSGIDAFILSSSDTKQISGNVKHNIKSFPHIRILELSNL